MTGKHTPMPWAIFKAGIGEENGDGIASLWREGGEREANAALIVRAVNAHEGLVKALEKAENALDPNTAGISPAGFIALRIQQGNARQNARAALALARGETP